MPRDQYLHIAACLLDETCQAPDGVRRHCAGRCAVCVVQRKGKCGTLSAPRKCLRRQAKAPVHRLYLAGKRPVGRPPKTAPKLYVPSKRPVGRPPKAAAGAGEPRPAGNYLLVLAAKLAASPQGVRSLGPQASGQAPRVGSSLSARQQERIRSTALAAVRRVRAAGAVGAPPRIERGRPDGASQASGGVPEGSQANAAAAASEPLSREAAGQAAKGAAVVRIVSRLKAPLGLTPLPQRARRPGGARALARPSSLGPADQAKLAPDGEHVAARRHTAASAAGAGAQERLATSSEEEHHPLGADKLQADSNGVSWPATLPAQHSAQDEVFAGQVKFFLNSWW
jgi:hypothetical protein